MATFVISAKINSFSWSGLSSEAVNVKKVFAVDFRMWCGRLSDSNKFESHFGGKCTLEIGLLLLCGAYRKPPPGYSKDPTSIPYDHPFP